MATRSRHRRSWLPLVAAAVLLLLTGCATGAPPGPPPAPPTTSAATPTPTTPPRTYAATPVKAYVTFYAGYDNDPPGSTEIAHPNDRHPSAGGTGTFEDPITLASDPRELPVGAVVYEPKLKRYFVMEDDCAPCIDEWGASKRPHVDLWISGGNDARVVACEESLTDDDMSTLEYDPPPGRAVDTRPLFSPDGRCWPST
jgi:hypothetical protein